jgi:hypothetical protein
MIRPARTPSGKGLRADRREGPGNPSNPAGSRRRSARFAPGIGGAGAPAAPPARQCPEWPGALESDGVQWARKGR